MMMNLFSIFDPSTSNYYSLNWLSLLMSMLFIFNLYWFIPSRWNLFNFLILMILFNEKKMLLIKYDNIWNNLLFLSMFMLILLNNFLGMFMYIFTSSSHLIFSLSLSLTMWMSFMLYGWLNYYNNMFIHLVPQNTPIMLMSFMVLIETISNMIRSGTLAVRLTANMIAGHLLMTLISSVSEKLNILGVILIIIIQSMLVILEFSVSIIQAYVFSILVTLYSNEMN